MLHGQVKGSLKGTILQFFQHAALGIPIVEAFKAGTPVITSNVTSMPEVASDAAILVDPFNPDEIASAMKEITKNEELRNQLIEKGFKRSKLFSWDNTAEKLWKTIMQTIK